METVRRCVLVVVTFTCAGCLGLPNTDLERQAMRNLVQITADPLGDTDSFLTLPENQRQALGKDDGRTFKEIISSLQKLEAQFVVDIKLVGFDGDGLHGAIVSPDDLLQHLVSLKMHTPAVALQQVTEEIWSHTELGVDQKLLFHVSKAPSQLNKQVEAAIAAEIHKRNSEDPSQKTLVPYDAVDTWIGESFNRSGLLEAVYILNPKSPGIPYAYTYSGSKTCPGTLWCGSERYLWIDLTAGPAMYGPSIQGHGQVLSHSIPRMEHYKGTWRNRAIVPELAALVQSACMHLLTPFALDAHLSDWKELVLQVIHIHDSVIPDHAASNMEQLSWVSDELQSLRFHGQHISMRHAFVGFGSCDACVAAYSRALQSRTFRPPGAESEIVSQSFLVSFILHRWLSENAFVNHIVDDSGARVDLAAGPQQRIIPIYLFELAIREPLLLDDGEMAVAFPDMVIAVHTQGGETPSGYSCGNKEIMINVANVGRPVLAAVLEAGWGVPKTSQSWTLESGMRVNHLWSVGHTPFGHLSDVQSLSFSQRDVARRNHILACLHEIVKVATKLLGNFADVSPTGHAYAVFPKQHLPMYFQRRNVLLHKLEKAVSHLSLLQFDTAMYFVRSSQHEVVALRELARMAAMEIDTRLVCAPKFRNLRYWLVFVAGAIVGAMVWVLRRAKAIKSKLV